jgi:hypothetical protein
MKHSTKVQKWFHRTLQIFFPIVFNGMYWFYRSPTDGNRSTTIANTNVNPSPLADARLIQRWKKFVWHVYRRISDASGRSVSFFHFYSSFSIRNKWVGGIFLFLIGYMQLAITINVGNFFCRNLPKLSRLICWRCHLLVVSRAAVLQRMQAIYAGFVFRSTRRTRTVLYMRSKIQSNQNEADPPSNR